MSRRVTGEGTISRHVRGGWVGKISCGSTATGKRVRKSVYGRTQEEVRQKMAAAIRQQKSGRNIADASTVSSWLKRWLDDDVKLRLGAKTIREYTDTVRDYIEPWLGKKKLQKLRPADVQKWQADLQRDGFTDNMRAKGIRVFRAAMNAALRLELIDRNPVAAIRAPKVVRRQIRSLEPEECSRLVRAAQSHRIGDIVTVAIMTGLRKAELFALRWEDVDLQASVITVRRALEEVAGKLRVKEPKSAAGRRSVVLEGLCVQALQSRKQKAEAEGMGCDVVGLVFPDADGGHLRGSNFDRRVWHPIRNSAKLDESVKFHDLRHTQASLLLATGAHPKVVQERLGHSDCALTLRTYSHLLSGLQAAAVGKLSGLGISAEDSQNRG